ncbi:hypothetical protein HI914_03924 [Erysiphe necator]|nr:hypothetical protein HI914_03924 [Erysiphe necator]
MQSQFFKVKAIFEYVSQHDDDLHFPIGQIINVTNEEDDEWYSGEFVDESGIKHQGIFPKNFVENYEPAAPQRPNRANISKKSTESIDSTSDGLDVTVKPENLSADPAQVTPLIQESPPSKSSPKNSVQGSSLVTQASKFHRSSPKRVPSYEKPIPPPVFEKPASNSFKDRVAAFNKASSSIPGPLKPGGLVPGDLSSFVKKPFIAPPPSKDAYIPLPRNHSTPSKMSRREVDQGLAKREIERQVKGEKFNPEPTDLKDLVNTDVKPTSLKERIALLQKQQIEQASRLVNAAHKKEKVKRPVKTNIEPTTQVEANDQKNPTLLENTDAKEFHKSSLLEDDKKIMSSSRKSIDDAPHFKVSTGNGNDMDLLGCTENIVENENKYKSHDLITNNENDSNINSSSQDFGSKNELSTGQNDDEDNGEDDEDDIDDEDEENDEISAEIKRKEELRARMAKMSGGMNMHGIFGPPGGLPTSSLIIPKMKSNNTSHAIEKKEDSSVSASQNESYTAIPLPGMAQRKHNDEQYDENRSPEPTLKSINSPLTIDEIDSSQKQIPSSHELSISDTTLKLKEIAIPPISKNIGPNDDLTTPQKPVADLEDELSPELQNSSPINLYVEKDQLEQKKDQQSLQKSIVNEESVVEDRVSSFTPVNLGQNKRASALPPPIPRGIISSQINSRDSQTQESGATSLSPTCDQQASSQVIPSQTTSEHSNEIIENEDDHENNITSSAHYIDIPKASSRELKDEDNLHLTSPILSSGSPHSTHSEKFRSHPPKPLQLASNKRLSIDMPRSAPPPPPSKIPSWENSNEDFESPGNFMPKKRAPSVPSITASTPDLEKIEDDIYSASPPRSSYTMPEHNPPPLPPRESVAPPRDSNDIPRSTTVSRRSVDLSRISLDPGYLAKDIDLAPMSYWWTQPSGIPPVLQGRQDILLESVESSSTFGVKDMVLKELYILFKDYSQTIVFAEFDPLNPADVKLEQKHEQPPRPHQDQLEQAHEQIGQSVFERVTARKETIVGDGKPQDLIKELLSPFKDALPPIGKRVYGALVYCNIANACTHQNDEIRPGDIITLRNAKFQGKHGALGAKYTMEVGKPHHVGVVSEWDGTKKKIRAWEQGRESKKVKLESFKLDDLKSGEVKVWRVMPRSWVGWQEKNEEQK